VPRITLIELVNYREWTEELGFDREGVVQVKQASIYGLLQDFFWAHNCFTLPFRYDYYIVLSNGLRESVLRDLFKKLNGITPYGVRIASAVHKYPIRALEKAFRALKNTDFHYEECGEEDPVVVAHIDLNKITELAALTSIYESFVEITKTYERIVEIAFRYNGLASYMGGDNIIAVLPEELLNAFLELIPSHIKVGIGISRNPRKALEYAAKALSTIRLDSSSRNIVIYRDDTSTP